MDLSPDRERAVRHALLGDLFAEYGPSALQRTLLDETLRLARARRRTRQLTRAALATAAALVLGGGLWQARPGRHGAPALPATPAPKSTLVFASSCPVIHTQPLAAASVISSRPLAADRVVTSTSTVAMIETLPGGAFRFIGDKELLALFAPQGGAMLMRTHDGEEHLILPGEKPEPPALR